MRGGTGGGRGRIEQLFGIILKSREKYIYIPANIVLVSMAQDPITLTSIIQYTVQSSELL